MPLSTKAIQRAIYLDFESEGEKPNGKQPPPVLGGATVEGVYVPTLLHPSLKNAAEFRSWGFDSLADYLKIIHEQALSEDRRIVFFSSTEFTLFKDHGIDIGDHGFDLLKPAKKSKLYKTVWDKYNIDKRRFRDPDVARTTRQSLRTGAFGLLTLIAADLGLKRPGSYGPGKTGARIRSALEQAGKKPDYESWSPSGKKNLTKLSNHNKHDCAATQYVLEHLAANS